MEKAEKVINTLSDLVSKAKWTRAYINKLPNSAFFGIEPCYGKTTDNKNARHLPYKDKNGKIDKAHVRNAMARVEQVKPICPDTNKEAFIKQIKIAKVAKKVGIEVSEDFLK